MSKQTKPGYDVIPSIFVLSAIASCFGLLPFMLFLGLRLYKGNVVPFNILIIFYIITIISIELLFWKLWKDKISESLKTKNWSISALSNTNFWVALTWILMGLFVEFLLIRATLILKFSIVLALFILVCSKIVGSFIQMISCGIFGVKTTVFLSFIFCIFASLLSLQDTLSVKILIILIVTKGLFGNLIAISRTVVADNALISFNKESL